MRKFKCQSCNAEYVADGFNVRYANGVAYMVCQNRDGWAHEVVEEVKEVKAETKPTTTKKATASKATQKEEA